MSYMKERAAPGRHQFIDGPPRQSRSCGEHYRTATSFVQPSCENNLNISPKVVKMSAEVAKRDEEFSAIEQVVLQGDLSKLTPVQRLTYYRRVCESAGLNPLTKPLQYILLNGKLTLYATKDCTEQLRKINGVSIEGLDCKVIDDLYIVKASAKDKTGRMDESTGAVVIGHLKGESKANAIMKAETKAKRRVTLSICGMGWIDESEINSIPNAKPVDVDLETGEIQIAQTTSKISYDQFSDLKLILAECSKDYQKWFMGYLKNQYNITAVSELPLEMFDKTKAAVLKAMENHHARQAEESKNVIEEEVQ